MKLLVINGPNLNMLGIRVSVSTSDVSPEIRSVQKIVICSEDVPQRYAVLS